MSTPVKPVKKELLHLLLSETISTISSLNMYPSAIPLPAYEYYEGKLNNDGDILGRYLSESDVNAKHAMEHLENTIEIIKCTIHVKEKLRAKVYQLRKKEHISDKTLDSIVDIIEEL